MSMIQEELKAVGVGHGRRPLVPVDRQTKVRTCFWLEPELHRKLRLYCDKAGVPMQEVLKHLVANAVEDKLLVRS